MDKSTIFATAVVFALITLPIALYNVWRKLADLRQRYKDLQEKHNEITSSLDRLHGELQTLQVDWESENAEHQSQNEEKDAEISGLKAASQAISNQFINDSLRFVSHGLTANNYETSVKKMEKAFNLIRAHNLDFPKSDEKEFYNSLRDSWKGEVKKQYAKEEQARIRERMREEAKEEAERQAELKRLERDKQVVAAALEKALRESNDQHSAEIEGWRNRLAEVEASYQRAVSQAQLTRTGNVYVISNIGSFGEDIFKIGMTRRLEPKDRIAELSSASVPFPFDIHMMISSDDAPSLETKLHRELSKLRINKVNSRKEFFRVSIAEIAEAVERNHGKVEYLVKPEALEYRESLLVTERGAEGEYDDAIGEDDEVAA